MQKVREVERDGKEGDTRIFIHFSISRNLSNDRSSIMLIFIIIFIRDFIIRPSVQRIKIGIRVPRGDGRGEWGSRSVLTARDTIWPPEQRTAEDRRPIRNQYLIEFRVVIVIVRSNRRLGQRRDVYGDSLASRILVNKAIITPTTINAERRYRPTGDPSDCWSAHFQGKKRRPSTHSKRGQSLYSVAKTVVNVINNYPPLPLDVCLCVPFCSIRPLYICLCADAWLSVCLLSATVNKTRFFQTPVV